MVSSASRLMQGLLEGDTCGPSLKDKRGMGTEGTAGSSENRCENTGATWNSGDNQGGELTGSLPR